MATRYKYVEPRETLFLLEKPVNCSTNEFQSVIDQPGIQIQ